MHAFDRMLRMTLHSILVYNIYAWFGEEINSLIRISEAIFTWQGQQVIWGHVSFYERSRNATIISPLLLLTCDFKKRVMQRGRFEKLIDT